MSGRIALITGGTRGLGLAIALRLARSGMIPAMLYRADEAQAADALGQVRAYTPDADCYRADITDAAAVETLVKRIKAELGPVEILVNNAFRSGRPAAKTHEIDPVSWREDIDTNLTGQFLVTRACLPHMVERHFGRVVFIGSLAMRGEQGRAAYATCKAALVGLTKTIAREYAADGITANVVSPGFIEVGAFMRLPEDVRNRATKLVPSKRAGTAENVASAVAYLCSDDADYTTGQLLGIDGGTL